MHRTGPGASGSGKLFAPVVLAVLLATGLIRYAIDHSGTPVSDAARVSAKSDQGKQNASTTEPAPATPSPASSAQKTSQPSEGSGKQASPAAPVRVTAIRVGQGLFTDVRVR